MGTAPSSIGFEAAGNLITAATWNNVGTAINFLINPPAFEGRQTTVQSIGNAGAVTAVLLDAEDFDNDNGHSLSVNTSRYTIQTPGRWQISGAVSYASNATGAREANIMVNGTTIYSAKYPAVNGDTSRFPTRTISKLFIAGDYVELGAWQNSGGNLNTAVATYEQATLSMRWVGTI